MAACKCFSELTLFSSSSLASNFYKKHLGLPKDLTVRTLQTESLIREPRNFSVYCDLVVNLRTTFMLIDPTTAIRGLKARAIKVTFQE